MYGTQSQHIRKKFLFSTPLVSRCTTSYTWLNRSRRLLVRWEKKGENYRAFLHVACAQLIFAKLAVFG